MEVHRKDMIKVEGIGKPQEFETYLATTPGRDTFSVSMEGDCLNSMEGDCLNSDAMMEYAVFEIDLTFEEATKLLNELWGWVVDGSS
jgi:hypothetical protein